MSGFYTREALKRTSLDPAQPKGRQLVVAVRDGLKKDRESVLACIQEQAKESVNLCTNTIREARWAVVDDRRTTWGEFGPNQGNIGKHIDALAGVVFGLDIAIDALNEILEEPRAGRSTPKDEQGGKEQEAAEETVKGKGKEPAKAASASKSRRPDPGVTERRDRKPARKARKGQ